MNGFDAVTIVESDSSLFPDLEVHYYYEPGEPQAIDCPEIPEVVTILGVRTIYGDVSHLYVNNNDRHTQVLEETILEELATCPECGYAVEAHRRCVCRAADLL